MFAKAPRSGFVKTRLARDVGPEVALRTYRSIGESVARRVGTEHRLTVWFDPPDGIEDMRRWLGEQEYSPQVAGDLGRRLSHAFEFHFQRGDCPVIAIGADAPEVNAATIADGGG